MGFDDIDAKTRFVDFSSHPAKDQRKNLKRRSKGSERMQLLRNNLIFLELTNTRQGLDLHEPYRPHCYRGNRSIEPS